MAITRHHARKALGVVRLVNGLGATLIPATMAKRFGIDPEADKTALYPLRLFGVRTVLLGLDYLRPEEPSRAVLRGGVLIHASDTTAAYLAGQSGQLPQKAAKTATTISSVNTLLSLYAAFGPDGSRKKRKRGRG